MTVTKGAGTILMIDDDTKLCGLVSDYLALFGFTVELAHSGPDGLDKLRAAEFDAVILDIMLPGLDGISVMRAIREFSIVPVLMLTSLADESDRIVGLEVGADDYLPKTFSTRELLARLRSMIRRTELHARASSPESLVVGDLKITPATRSVARGDEKIALTALEFDLLHCLARSAGRVLDRDQLLDALTADSFDRSIDVHISILRRKLGDDSKNPRYIKTVRSVGYMLMPTPDYEI